MMKLWVRDLFFFLSKKFENGFFSIEETSQGEVYPEIIIRVFPNGKPPTETDDEK